MIVHDVPVSGRAIHELYLSSVSTARNCKITSGVGVFFGGQLGDLDAAVMYMSMTQNPNTAGILICPPVGLYNQPHLSPDVTLAVVSSFRNSVGRNVQC
jgi:hypothetical protein